MAHFLKFLGILALIWIVNVFIPYGYFIGQLIVAACIWIAVK